MKEYVLLAHAHIENDSLRILNHRSVDGGVNCNPKRQKVGCTASVTSQTSWRATFTFACTLRSTYSRWSISFFHVRPVLMVVDSSPASFLFQSPAFKCRCYVTIWGLEFPDALYLGWIVTFGKQPSRHVSPMTRVSDIWTSNAYSRRKFISFPVRDETKVG